MTGECLFFWRLRPTDSPYGLDATTYGHNVATFAKGAGFDGVDFDLENLGTYCTAGTMSGTATVAWMAAATTAARAVYGVNGFISHAPQAPYFGAVGSSSMWAGTTGCYTGLSNAVGSQIDWFNVQVRVDVDVDVDVLWCVAFVCEVGNMVCAEATHADVDDVGVQFYNQGATCYTSYTSLFVASNGDGSCPSFPGTSVAEIASYGVPLASIVVGKPLLSADAGTGYVTGSSLGAMVATAGGAGGIGWSAGVMIWAWDDVAAPAWVATLTP